MLPIDVMTFRRERVPGLRVCAMLALAAGCPSSERGTGDAATASDANDSADSNAPVVFADAQWQVRCPDGLAGCASAGDRVDVFSFTDMDGLTATCNLRASGPDSIVDLAIDVRGQSLTIANLVTGASGGAVRGGCEITVVDDQTTYGGSNFGVCGGGVPGPMQPCQISNLVIDPGDPEGPTVAMDVLCRSLAAATDPVRLQRDLVGPAESARPARIRLLNCPGVE